MAQPLNMPDDPRTAYIERLRGRLRQCQGELRDRALTPKFDHKGDCIGFTCDLCEAEGENEDVVEHDEDCPLVPEKR